MGDNIENHPHIIAMTQALQELKQGMALLLQDRGKNPAAAAPSSSAIQRTEEEAIPLDEDDNVFQSRFTKMDFPHFSGQEDPLIWLHRCELYFRNSRTPNQDKVTLAAFNMTGEAQLWYYQILRDEPLMSWRVFKEACKLRFGPPQSINPLGELVNWKQRGRHINEYISDFQLLLARADTVRVDQQVDLFTAGLDELLRIDVERTRPESLAEAINTARDFYRKIQLITTGSSRQLSRPLPPPIGRTIVPISDTKPQPAQKHSLKAPPIRRLSPTEQEERKAKGLCFNCDETWFRGHRCKRLFCILGIDDEEDTFEQGIEETNIAEISLYAITGVKTGQMMKVGVTIAGEHLVALIDSGSTHNFINTSTAYKLGLPITPKPGIKVAVADGEQLPSSGSCEQVLVHHGSDCFLGNFLLLPLAGFDLVLGVSWLSTLGPIWWDFNTLTMQFYLNGRKVSWLGEKPSNNIALNTIQPISNQNLFTLSGTKLCLSSSYHPQTDGQTEVVNRTIEMYLRCLVGDHPCKWVRFLPWAEYCYNTSFHSSLHTTPFQVVYGRPPPRLLSYEPGHSKLDVVDEALKTIDEVLRDAKYHLQLAQSRMEQTYNRVHKDISFEQGQWVWLKLQPYRQHSISRRTHHKLSPRFYGPFKVLKKIGKVAYQLAIPPDSKVHDVFHVSLLKEHKGPPPTVVNPLPAAVDGQVLIQPAIVLKTRINRGVLEILVQWDGRTKEDATWETFRTFQEKFPNFKLEDKLDVPEGSNDAFWGKGYCRRGKPAQGKLNVERKSN